MKNICLYRFSEITQRYPYYETLIGLYIQFPEILLYMITVYSLQN